MAFPSAYAITANSLTAETFRQAPSSLIAGSGVVGSGDLQVTANSPAAMNVLVAVGQIWMPGTLASTSGFPSNLNAQTSYGLPSTFNEQASYFAWNNGTVTVTISAADPTNPRIDLIVAYVQDAQYSGSNNQAVIGVITGTAAPSPSAPSAPASAVVLAQIAVAAGATSITSGNITDERPFIALRSPSRGNPAGIASFGATQILTTATQINLSASALYGGVTVSSNSYVVPTAGLYRVTASLMLDNAAPLTSYNWTLMVYQNGAEAGVMQRGENNSFGFPVMALNKSLVCAASDQIAFYATVSSATYLQPDGKGSFAEISLVTR
jgi:hypothetical protein